jgi:hypothetical protein
MHRTTALALLLVVTAGAYAQNNAVVWSRNVQAAVSEAQRTGKPLMVYVLASERYRDDQLDREQKRTFRDPRVMEKAKSFVPLRLSRAQHRDMLDDFGFGEHSNMVINFVSPDGEVLGSISAPGIAQEESMLQKMSRILDVYGKHIFDTKVKPVLDDKKAKPNDMRQAIALIAQFRIKSADKAVLEVLERERLDGSTKKICLDTLAVLSTKAAVEKLLEEARGGDKLAERALGNCNPAGAELLLDELKADVEPFDYMIYQTLVKICRVPEARPERYMENSSLQRKQEEVERVKNIVRETARRWKAGQ